MCLHSVSKNIAKFPSGIPCTKDGIGFKVFNRFFEGYDKAFVVDKFKTEIRGDFTKIFEMEKWHNWKEFDKSPLEEGIKYYDEGDDKYSAYPKGFHIFTSLEEAEKWKDTSSATAIIIEVEYKNAQTFGFQHGAEVVVADDIRLLDYESYE